MKAAAFGARAYPEIAASLRGLSDPFPTIDLETLRAGPAQSFGRHYAAVMDANGLRPFSVSREVTDALWPDHVLEVRYPLLHDAFHVLLGFDTTLPGELGVWSFVSGQHYSPAFDRAARLGRALYPLIAPRQRLALRAAAAHGHLLATRAACLIVEPLDRYFLEPLDTVRARLGLADANADAVNA
jgi:ubiquinone biosynthesis protein Coq4